MRVEGLAPTLSLSPSRLKEFVPSHFHFLLRGPSVPVLNENPLGDWLLNKSWAAPLKILHSSQRERARERGFQLWY